ncbi:helix-loop-helix DNA-binding domain-containing protein [Cercophora newfieldiana]|uniref:Helix-loop-helix DNA-binding domain-containing protein n=1 Tax=Cercophora newfieldiana TaxID=92897 RepID=A0AA39YP47_9PEZI|nr:helix-loop-helix DNA-binding domain-containing protein [Cercophora newfieldiana]
MPAAKPEGTPDMDIKLESGDERPRLTEEEKKANHIASEQKRRQAIRNGFDRLTELVPGLENQGRSEGLVLVKTVEFIREQVEERKRLVKELEERGVKVPDSQKM